VPFTVQQIADWIGGEIAGDSSLIIQNARSLGEASPEDITFVDNEKNLKAWTESKAAAAVVSKKFPAGERTLIRVEDPLSAFLQLALKLRGNRDSARQLDPTASIHPTARIGANASIGPFAVIGEGTTIGANATLHAGATVGRFCKLGDDVTIFPRAVLYDDCTLGHRTIIHANAVIGADGFGYRPVNGMHVKIPQLGSVEIGEDVEIGAGTTVDRGTFGPTRIGDGTKIDNLVMISHNCQIGKHNILVSQAGIAGSSSTGDYVILAGQVGVANGLHIGEHSVVGAQCGIIQDVPAKSRLLGSPAMPGNDYMRCVANWAKIPELRKDVKRIKKHLNLGDTE
jgi:UDP-3-O-[3-hydroxymyristoyl] glucosamine N-acyltransferase